VQGETSPGITKDAFEPNLPLSVVVHIDYKKAPLVIQQLGDVKRLVEQTLDPMVSAYFKNIGQTRTLIQLIQDRSAIQDLSSEQMKAKVASYHLELKEVLIGTPSSQPGDKGDRADLDAAPRPPDRRGAGRDLRPAGEGRRQGARAAGGEAQRIKALAAAEAEKAARVGIAQALAIEEQVRASGGPQLLLTRHVMERFSEAVELAKIDVVPKVMISGAGGGGSQGNQGSVFEALLALVLSDKVNEKVQDMPARDAQLDHVRDTIRDGLVATLRNSDESAVALRDR